MPEQKAPESSEVDLGAFASTAAPICSLDTRNSHRDHAGSLNTT